MRAGLLKVPLTIHALSSTTLDSRGQASTGTKAIGLVWARVEPISGSESEFARKLSADVSHTITVRYLPTLNERHKLKESDGLKRTFHVRGIVHDEGNRMTTITAGEDKG